MNRIRWRLSTRGHGRHRESQLRGRSTARAATVADSRASPPRSAPEDPRSPGSQPRSKQVADYALLPHLMPESLAARGSVIPGGSRKLLARGQTGQDAADQRRSHAGRGSRMSVPRLTARRYPACRRRDDHGGRLRPGSGWLALVPPAGTYAGAGRGPRAWFCRNAGDFPVARPPVPIQARVMGAAGATLPGSAIRAVLV